MTTLRVATAGSVDDGKSTLIGRLLFDSKNVLRDQLAAVERTSKARGDEHLDLSLLTDGLRSEREQGITIDVAYRHFATAKRTFIIADTPGHAQYTRNMVTGASTADLAIVLVDARAGLLEQSRRHAVLSSLLGIRHLVLAVNKMDLIDWDADRFARIRDEFHRFAARLGIPDVRAIPLSALYGDNVATGSTRSPWYSGPTLLAHLEDVPVAGERGGAHPRFPVQCVIRSPGADGRGQRGYAGSVAGGVLKVGSRVVALPAGIASTVTGIEGPSGPVDEAVAPTAISLILSDDIDLSRGDMLVGPDNQPEVTRDVEAMLCWMSAGSTLTEGAEFLIKHTTRTTRCRITGIDYRLDVNTLRNQCSADSLVLNDIGRVRLRTQTPLAIDEYTRNSTTGSFILIDPRSNDTVGAGMVVASATRDQPAPREPAAASHSPNTVRHTSLVTAADRCSRGCTVWFTGLSGAGKSSVAAHVERRLLRAGRPAFVLDGDTLRHGLNADLGFSPRDRAENLRRLAHVAALLAASGQVALVSAISPLREHRELARAVHRDAGLAFYEVFVDTPLRVCIARDPKGLYAKALAGKITEFTGIDSPYEPPVAPALRLVPEHSCEEQAAEVIALLDAAVTA